MSTSVSVTASSTPAAVKIIIEYDTTQSNSSQGSIERKFSSFLLQHPGCTVITWNKSTNESTQSSYSPILFPVTAFSKDHTEENSLIIIATGGNVSTSITHIKNQLLNHVPEVPAEKVNTLTATSSCIFVLDTKTKKCFFETGSPECEMEIDINNKGIPKRRIYEEDVEQAIATLDTRFQELERRMNHVYPQIFGTTTTLYQFTPPPQGQGLLARVNNCELRLLALEQRAAGYVSSWILDKNEGKNRKVVFNHNLGTIPSLFIVYFKPENGTSVHILNYWSEDYRGGPVDVEATSTDIILHMFSGVCVFGTWDTVAGWNRFSSGYWQVHAWQ